MSDPLFDLLPDDELDLLVELYSGKQEPDNLEPRAHCGMLFDESSSMQPFQHAFAPAWQTMLHELNRLPTSRLRLELAVGSFASGVKFHDFAPIPHYLETNIKLNAGGFTLLGTALKTAIERTLNRRQQLADDGIQVHRSVLIVVTDGAATDGDVLAEILPTVQRLEREQIIEVVPVALDDQCRPLLKQVFGKEPSRVGELDFGMLFKAIAKSMAEYSRSSAGYEPSVCELIALAYQNEVQRLEEEQSSNKHVRQILPPKK